jgi:hypothetical protein
MAEERTPLPKLGQIGCCLQALCFGDFNLGFVYGPGPGGCAPVHRRRQIPNKANPEAKARQLAGSQPSRRRTAYPTLHPGPVTCMH